MCRSEEVALHNIHYSNEIHSMAKEINDLAMAVNHRRKGLKHVVLKDEATVAQAEAVAQKARAKYESLLQDLSKAINASREGLQPKARRFGVVKKSVTQVTDLKSIAYCSW